MQVEYKDVDDEQLLSEHETSETEADDEKPEDKDQQLGPAYAAPMEEDEAIDSEDDYPKGSITLITF